MKRIWAPWRVEYIRGSKEKACIFCQKPREDDDTSNYVLFRGKSNLVMLNKYPYNPGHLMVAPYKHISSLDGLGQEELFEHFDLVRKSVRVLTEVYKPAGFNIGINMGKVAGAGVEDHIHTHIVPRWNGDTNFITVVSDVRVIPEALAATYENLKGSFA
ncbi:MAG: HIT domain-containing protein [Dehalococcoidia bacterium]|nr:HIT domain-containing protein [Dehalococcoidia bacterium]